MMSVEIIRICETLKRPEGKRGIPYVGRLRYKILSTIENVVVKKMRIKEYRLNTENREQKIIVSLTSFPARINTVEYAVKSLMSQDYKADRIVLWLAEGQFTNLDLPKGLVDLQKYGLEIKFCDDLKSHKKYFYAMKEQGNNLLITYDDDLIYPPDSIKKLIESYKVYMNCIICNRGQTISFNEDGTLKSARFFKRYTDEGINKPSFKLMASTGAGCLYPPKILSDEVYNWNMIKENALSADDLWMKVIEVLSGVQVVKTSKRQKTLTMISGSQKESLTTINDIGGQNDIVLKNLMKCYPEVLNKLKEYHN